MEIIKVINNNVALARNERGKEVIIKGKGLAFQRQAGDIVNKEIVEQFFYLSDKETFERFDELLTEMPIEYLDLAVKIIDQSKLILGKKLNESIYLSLADHIYNTILRKKEGIELKNALLWEIKSFYPDEYKIGKLALSYIKETFDITLAEDEIGFIALHIVNAEVEEGSPDAYKVTKLMQEIANIVRLFFKINFEEDSVYYYRFITHLKFFSQRVIADKTYDSQEDPEMISFMQRKYHRSYLCVEKISEFLLNNYRYQLSDEEGLYLTVHIQKVISQ
ncbi:BglG family transcription antiterminator LicT [Enterococcus sp. LJL99]